MQVLHFRLAARGLPGLEACQHSWRSLQHRSDSWREPGWSRMHGPRGAFRLLTGYPHETLVVKEPRWVISTFILNYNLTCRNRRGHSVVTKHRRQVFRPATTSSRRAKLLYCGLLGLVGSFTYLCFENKVACLRSAPGSLARYLS